MYYLSSLLIVKVEDETSFGKYICHIQDRFQSITHTSSVQEDTGNNSVKIQLESKKGDFDF